MEQLYLIEIFINKVNLVSDNNIKRKDSEKLSVSIDFGKYASFVIKQDEFKKELLAKASEEIAAEELGREKNIPKHDLRESYLESEETSETSKEDARIPKDFISLTGRSVSFQIKNFKSDSKDESVLNEEFMRSSKRSVRLSDIDESPNESFLRCHARLDQNLSESFSDTPSAFGSANKSSENTSMIQLTKIFNAGASLLFSSHSENLVQTFRLFPLELSVWSDNEFEKNPCIGITRFLWDTEFYMLITNKIASSQKPVTLKEKLILRSEYSGGIVGDISLYLRLSCLGQVVLTMFKVLDNTDNKAVLLKSDTRKSLFKCEMFEESSDFQNVTTEPIDNDFTIENLEFTPVHNTDQARRPSGMSGDGGVFTNGEHEKETSSDSNTYNGPIFCGEPGCKLKELLKMYFTQKESNQFDASSTEVTDSKQNSTQCCYCRNKDPGSISLTESSNSIQPQSMVVCKGCGGVSFSGETCNGLVITKDAEKNIKADKESAVIKESIDVEQTESCDNDTVNFENPEIQKCLYAGIAKMLANMKNRTHKKYCSQFKHKSACQKRNE